MKTVPLQGINQKSQVLQIKFCSIAFFLLSTFYCQATTYYSQSSSTANTLSNWNSVRTGGGSSPANFSTSSDQFVIQNGHTITSSSSWTLSGINMVVQVESGGTLIGNSTIDLTPTATFQIDNGGTYQHNFSGNTIFDGDESFGSSSSVELLALPATTLDHSIVFGNLTVNISSGGSLRVDCADNETFSIAGNLTVSSTGGGSNELRMATGSGDNVTLDIAGDFILNGGIFNFYSSSGGTNGLINLGGDMLFTGGTWGNDGSNNLSVNFDTDNSASEANFNGFTDVSAIIDVDWTIPVGKTITLLSAMEIGSGEVLTVHGQLNFGTFQTNGSGSLTVSSTGILGIGSNDGIDDASTIGNIGFPSSRRSIDPACHIIYNGTGSQSTGDGLNNIGTLTGTVQISNTSSTFNLTEDFEFGDGFEFIVDASATLLMESTDEIIRNSGSIASLEINGTVQTQASDGFSLLATGGGESFQGFTSCTFGADGLINYNRSGSQSVSNQFSYQNLTLSGSTNKTIAGILDINGDFNLSGTATVILGSNQVNLAGSWTSASGTSITEGTSTIELDGTGSQTINTDGTEQFYNIAKTGSGTTTAQDGINLANGGQLRITNGTLDMGTNSLQSTSTNRTLIMTGGILNLEEINATNQPNFATVTISGGTIQLSGLGAMELNGGETYNNLTFSGSGTKTISSATPDIDGTVYITTTCTLDVGNRTFGDGSTNLTMDGGHFLIEGSGSKPNISGTYTLTGGTIEFSGSSSLSIRSPRTYYNVLISGSNVSASSGDYTLANGGHWTVESTGLWQSSNKKIRTSGTASVTINGTFQCENENGLSGSSLTSIHSSIASVTIGSSSTLIYNRTGAQSISDRDDYANLEIDGSGAKNWTGTPEISGNLDLSGGTHSYPTSIEFDGASAQEIDGDNFGTCTIILSGGGEKDLTNPATINGTCTFTSGLLDLGSNDLTFGTSATVSSASASSFVKINGSGRVLRTISSGSTFDFPIGLSTSYFPVAISCGSCTNEPLEIGIEDVIYDNPVSQTTTFASAGHTNYVNKTWDMVTNGIAGSVTVNLQWTSADQTVNPGSNNSNNDLAIGRWLSGTSTAWDDDVIASSNVSGTIYNLSRTLSSFNTGTYFIGVGSGNTPLPVELISFSTTCTDGKEKLEWSTATEINNSHFEIESSSDGINFYTVKEIKGQGNKKFNTNYSYTLHHPSPFYRLAQYDFDGTINYSDIIASKCLVVDEVHPQVSIFNKQLSLSQINTPTTLRILSIQGEILLEARAEENNIINLSHLPVGIYIVWIGNYWKKIRL